MSREKCKHCGRIIVHTATHWVHFGGIAHGEKRCPIRKGRHFEAAPYGEPCRIGCDAAEPGLRVVGDE